MSTNTTKSHRAVLCKRCNAPIPVSSIVADLQERIERGEANSGCAFSARCRSCHDESVYAIDDIRRVDGEPRKRIRLRTTKTRAT
jgi:hypothetical protein